MAYNVTEVTEIAPSVLRRLFDQCEEKLDTGTFPFPEGIDSDAKYAIFQNDFEAYAQNNTVYLISLNGYIVSAICGKRTGTTFHHMLMLAGRDVNGSRSYLYDPDFALAIADYHRAQGDTETTKSLMAGASMVGYHEQIWPNAGCTTLTNTESSIDSTGNPLSNWTSVL